MTINGWYEFFDTALPILDKKAQEDHYYNYIYQLPNDDSYKQLMNSLWPEYSLGGLFYSTINEFVNDKYGVEYYYFNEHFGYDYEMRNFITNIRLSDKTLADVFNIPDYSLTSYLNDINELVSIAVDNLYSSDLQGYISEINNVYDFVTNWKSINKEKT